MGQAVPGSEPLSPHHETVVNTTATLRGNTLYSIIINYFRTKNVPLPPAPARRGPAGAARELCPRPPGCAPAAALSPGGTSAVRAGQRGQDRGARVREGSEPRGAGPGSAPPLCRAPHRAARAGPAPRGTKHRAGPGRPHCPRSGRAAAAPRAGRKGRGRSQTMPPPNPSAGTPRLSSR